MHVFISYSRKDLKIADKLKDRINNTGFDAWIDRERLGGGDDWTEEIQKAIKSAYALIVIKSPASAASDNVKHEWSYALGEGVPVIPILYKYVSRLSILVSTFTGRVISFPASLEKYNHIDFTDPKWPRWREFIQLLEKYHDEAGTKVPIPLDTPPQIKRALQILNEGNPDEKLSAIHMLVSSNYPIKVQAFVTMIQDQGGGMNGTVVGETAAKAIVQLGDKSAVSPLLQLLAHADPNIRLRTTWVLGELGDQRATNELLKLLNHRGYIPRSLLR